jgi:hypothetical protein
MRKLLLLLGVFLLFVLNSCEDVTGPAGSDDTGAIPVPPPELSLLAGDGRIEVVWTKVVTATGYELYYGTDADPLNAAAWTQIQVNTSNRVEALITGLENGKPYHVWGRAVYAHGTSDYSEDQTATPLPPPAYSPEFTAVLAGDEELDLTWSLVEGAAAYEVYYRNSPVPPSPDISSLAPGPDTGLVSLAADAAGPESAGTLIQGLENGTPYYLWVRAVNTAGRSDYSTPPVMATPEGATAPPAAPVLSGVIGGDRKITLSWNAVAWAKTYTVYCSETATPPDEPVPEENLSISVTGKTVAGVITRLEYGTTYYVWVRAHNSRGDSDYSPAGTGVPQPKPVIDYDNNSFLIGTAAAEFIFAEEGNSDRLTQKKETALANLYADGLRWYLKEYEETYGDLDFVFLTGRYTRGGPLSPGNVTVGNIKGIANSTLTRDGFTLITLTAAQVIELFDTAAAVSHTGNGGHPTGAWGVVSNEVSYTINYNGDTKGVIEPGTLLIHGQPVDMTRKYRVCTLTYVAEVEDDGYVVFYDAAITSGSNKKSYNYAVWKAVVEYIYQQDLPLHPDNYLKPGQPRVTRINDNYVK